MKYVIDIDQTLLYSKYNKIDGNYEIIDINDDLIIEVQRLHHEGHTIIIWTGRHWNHLEQTKKQLDFFNIPYTTLLMGKPFADVYIDDKAVTPEIFMEGVE